MSQYLINFGIHLSDLGVHLSFQRFKITFNFSFGLFQLISESLDVASIIIRTILHIYHLRKAYKSIAVAIQVIPEEHLIHVLLIDLDS
jgi:hypothetical protein